MTLPIGAKHGELEPEPSTTYVVVHTEAEDEPPDDEDLRPVDQPVEDEDDEDQGGS